MFSRDFVNNAQPSKKPTPRAFREAMKFNNSQRALRVSLKVWLFNVDDNNRDVVVRPLSNRISV